MPWGRRTFQRRSLSSTFNTKLASPGGWSNGASNNLSLRSDDDLRTIEISIVTRPFVLDFAGAYLDNPPDLSEEVWTEWEIQKAEQFDARWPIVRSVLAAFEELDIHILDVTPTNIAFLE